MPAKRVAKQLGFGFSFVAAFRWDFQALAQHTPPKALAVLSALEPVFCTKELCLCQHQTPVTTGLLR